MHSTHFLCCLQVSVLYVGFDMSSSREYLDMDTAKSGSTITFRGNAGFFISRAKAVLGLIFIAGALVAVGLLVYYLAPCGHKESAIAQSLEAGSSSNATQAAEDDHQVSPKKKTLEEVLLPRSLTPIHYDVELRPFLPPGNFTIAGKLNLTVHVVSTTRNITVHVLNVTVYEETARVVGGIDGKRVDIEGFYPNPDVQMLTIRTKTDLVAGQTYNVSFSFQSLVTDGLAGFYRSFYEENGEKKWMAVTQFQPTDARRAFPCMDEPALKATFAITLVRPTNMTSLSNMPILTTNHRDDWAADVYQTTVNMSTYLLAFAVSDFAHLKSNDTDVEFKVWTRPAAIHQGEYALEIGPKILDFYANYFNVSFPLPKMDFIALTDFQAGAMENWGLITYRETAMLLDNELSTPANKQRVATVVAHELAHQWFGNLVTPAWWDDLWLNEGFASYVELIGSDHVEPTWKMLDQAVILDVQEAMDLDGLANSHPVSVPVKDPNEINEIFDKISYSKGASIIRMMIFFLGEPTFRKGMESYLKTLKFSNAVQDDLWHHLTMASNVSGSNINVKEVMDTWTLQMGYPLINLHRDYTKQVAHLMQKRFLLVPASAQQQETDKTKYKWHVPITYTSQDKLDFNNTTPRLWLRPDQVGHVELVASDGVPPETDWMIINIRETGYYRVNYDSKNWKMLIRQLGENHAAIHETNRAQLLDDAFDLARAGILEYGVALNLTAYLEKETDYIPWVAAIDSLAYLDLMLRSTEAYGKWTSFMRRLVTPAYEAIGFQDSPDSPHLERLNRVNLIAYACKFGHKGCISESLSLYQKWMADPQNAKISPSMKGVVSCNAIRYGSREEWDFAWKQYLESNVASDKNTMLAAMACSREPWILARYLNWSMDVEMGIRQQDASTVFRTVAANPIGRYIAFDFFRDKWADIKKMYGTGFFALSNMMKAVAQPLNSHFDVEQFVDFGRKHSGEFGSATRTYQQALEETKGNAAWIDQHYSTVSRWLDIVDGFKGSP
jgi:aminopeptidase N